jgi:hypothetical protein
VTPKRVPQFSTKSGQIRKYLKFPELDFTFKSGQWVYRPNYGRNVPAISEQEADEAQLIMDQNSLDLYLEKLGPLRDPEWQTHAPLRGSQLQFLNGTNDHEMIPNDEDFQPPFSNEFEEGHLEQRREAAYRRYERNEGLEELRERPGR